MPDSDFDRLWFTARLQAGLRVLDIGAGTGRLAVPFARRGCSVFALEPAREMLSQLQARSGDNGPVLILAEGSGLPFPSTSFDVVIIARLLYLTSDWREILREADRVLADGGCLLHEWGNGQAHEAWVQIRERARELFEEAGQSAPFHPGVRSETDIDLELETLRFVSEGKLDLGPGPVLTLQEFLRRIIEGELSYVWNVPTDVRARCLPRLRAWAETAFDLERPVPMPETLCWTIYRRSAA